ncbi:MAG: hypothetical protein AB1Z98_25110 [Nannocystaceae bacterium]
MMINELESTTWVSGLVAVVSMLAGGCILGDEDRKLHQPIGAVSASETGNDQDGGSGDEDTEGDHGTDGSDTSSGSGSGSDSGTTGGGDETDTDGIEVDDTTGTTGDEGVEPLTECPPMIYANDIGSLGSPDLNDVSGVAASRAGPGLWMHNGNQDGERVLLTSLDGTVQFEVVTWSGDESDFEDIAVGPGPVPGKSYVYVGDIGDDTATRSWIQIWRFQDFVDPLLFDGLLDYYVYWYPDGPHDAETLFVDPVDAAVYIVAEASGGARLYRAQTLTNYDILEDLGPIDIPFLPTAGDISPQGDFIVMRGTSEGRLWLRAPGQTIADALQQAPCELRIEPEEDGQAIAIMPDERSYVTTSEGLYQPIWHYEF